MQKVEEASSCSKCKSKVDNSSNITICESCNKIVWKDKKYFIIATEAELKILSAVFPTTIKNLKEKLKHENS